MYKSYFADIEGKCKYRITLFDRKRLDNSYYLINGEFEEIKLLNDSIIIDNGESLNLTFFLNQEQIFNIIDTNKEIFCLVHRMNDIYYQYDDYKEKDTDEEDLTQNLLFFGKLQQDIYNTLYTEQYTELQLKFNYILEEYKKVDILKDYLPKHSEYLNIWELIQYIAKNSLYDKIYLNVNRDFRDEKYNKNIFQNMIISRSYLEEKQDLNIYDFLFDLLDFVNYDIKIYENKLYLIDKSIYTFNEIETYFITYSLYYGEIDKNVLNITEKEVIKHYSYINEGTSVYDTEPKEINNTYFFSNDSNISVREGVNKYIFKQDNIKYENISLDNDINNFELLESTSKESVGKKEELGVADYFYNRLYYREDGNGNFYNIDNNLSSTEGNREGLSVVNYFENASDTDKQLFYKMGLFPNFSDTDKQNFDFIDNVTFHSYEILDNMGRTTNKDKIINNRQFGNIEAFRKNQFACFIDYYHSNTKNSFRPISELKRAFYFSNSQIHSYKSLQKRSEKLEREQNLLKCPIIEIETKKFNLTDKQHLAIDFEYKLYQNYYQLPILRTGVNEDLDVDLDWNNKAYIWVKIEANGLYYDSDKKGFYKENKPTKIYINNASGIYKGTPLKPINTLDNKNFESNLNNGFVIYNNLKGINNISLKISFYPPNIYMFVKKVEISNVLLENLKLDYVDIVDYKLLRNKKEKTNKDRKIDKYLEKEINLNFHSVNEQDEQITIYKNTLLYQDYNNNKVEYYPNFVIYGTDFDFIDLYRNIYLRKTNKATIEFNSTLYDNFIYDNFLESFYKYKFIPNKIFHIDRYKFDLLKKELNITFLENM